MRSIDRQKNPLHNRRDQDEFPNGELVNNYEDIHGDFEEQPDWINRPDYNNEKLTEDHLVAAAVNYSHGQLPVVNQILCLNDPDLRALDHIPVLQRSILHPVLALKILYYRIIRYLGRQSFRLFLPITGNDSNLLLLMLLYVFLSSDNILLFLPMILYYVTFGVMVITTFQMLQAKRDYQDFRVWSRLFITYSGGGLNGQEAEFQFIRNNLKPYGHFFLALLLNIMVYPVIAKQWILQSELTVISFILTFITLLGFMPKKHSKTLPDTLVLFSFAVNVIAKYPYEIDTVVTQGWRFLDLKMPTFAGYIVGNGIEFCINFRLLFYIFIPLLLIQVAARENWRGTYKALIPHCVTLSWLQIIIISSQGATMFGLLRATLALVGIVLFLPMVGLTSVILPAVAITKWIATNFNYSLFVFFCILLPMLLICWWIARGRYKEYTSIVQIMFVLITITVILNMDFKFKTDLIEEEHTKPLSWEIYQKFCHQPSWEQSNIALTQHKCLDLNNVKVSWDGYVNTVKIRSVTNRLQQIFDRLPQSVGNFLYCMYGDEIMENCNDSSDLLKTNCLNFYEMIKSRRRCSLARFNTYVFEISVRMKSGMWGKTAETVLIVDDFFKNFSFALQPSDYIWFKGALISEESSESIVGGLRPHIVADEIGCFDCLSSELTQMKRNTMEEIKLKDVLNNLLLGVKCVLNFLFNPIVIFK